jgi:hypothetical protein
MRVGMQRHKMALQAVLYVTFAGGVVELATSLARQLNTPLLAGTSCRLAAVDATTSAAAATAVAPPAAQLKLT